MIGDASFMPPSRERIEAAGKIVIPGFVDPHIHFGLQGPMPEVKRVTRDFELETRGAVHGGVTTCLLMLLDSDSPTSDTDELIEWGNGHSFVDFGFVVLVRNREEIQAIDPLFEKGITTFKHFFTAFRKGQAYVEDPTTPRYYGCDEGTFYESLEHIQKLGPPALAMVHAEDSDLYNVFIPRARATGKNDLDIWESGRPPICEFSRVEFAAQIDESTGCPLHYAHFSTARSVEILSRYLAKGVDLSAEVVPHTLTVTKHEWDEIGVWGKFVPPLRGSEEINALWQGVRAGTIRHITTDHCSLSCKEKEQGKGKFGSVWETPPGISNVHGHWLPILLTEGVRKGRITLQKMVEICSENNARRFGLYPKKGTIAVGSDADILIVDPSAEQLVDEGFYHGRSPEISIHMGKRLIGKPWLTMIRGKTIVRDWKTVAESGWGKFVPSLRL